MPSQPSPWQPEPSESRAVLVGVSDYTQLDSLPAVANNLQTLKDLLTDPQYWGLPEHCCNVLSDPDDSRTVLDAIHTAASEAKEALVFYFAGHGLLDEQLSLYLALKDSHRDQIYRATRYDDVRREMVRTASRCRAKVAILDCCYSGRALQGGMGGSLEIADHARIEGTYLMTASAETSIALAPPGDSYTAFTGAVIDGIKNGVPSESELIDLETLFFHVRGLLEERRFPLPQQRARNYGNTIALARNIGTRRLAMPVSAHAIPAAPSPIPPEIKPVLSLPIAHIASRISELRGTDSTRREADNLVGAVATHREDQEVASLYALLRRRGDDQDADCLAAAIAQRPHAAIAVLETLGLTDSSDDVIALLESIVRGSAESAAYLARALRDNDRTRDLALFLDVAVAAAAEDRSRAHLLGALWTAGFREEIDQAFQGVATQLSAPNAVALADELRKVGHEEVAFGLYAAGAESMSERDPVEIAQLTSTMRSSGFQEESERVAAAAAGAQRQSSHAILALAREFLNTGQDSYAERVLDSNAYAFSDSAVLGLAASLREAGHAAASLQLLAKTAANRSAETALRFVHEMRELGRQIDAIGLLESIAEKIAPEQLSALYVDLLAEGKHRDAERVLHVVSERSPSEFALLLESLANMELPSGPEVVERLVQECSPERLSSVAEALRKNDSATTISDFHSAVARTSTPERLASCLTRMQKEAARQLFLAVATRARAKLSDVLDLLTLKLEGRDPWLVVDLLSPREAAHIAALVAALRNAGYNRHADAVLDQASAHDTPVEELAVAIQKLRLAGWESDADRLLSDTVAEHFVFGVKQGRTAPELVEFLFALDAGGQRSDIESALGQISATRDPALVADLATLLDTAGLPNYAMRLRSVGPSESRQRRRRRRG